MSGTNSAEPMPDAHLQPCGPLQQAYQPEDDSGLLKMIFSLKTRRLLGVYIVDEGATELVHIGQAVLNLKGIVEYFVENTFNYSTLTEA